MKQGCYVVALAGGLGWLAPLLCVPSRYAAADGSLTGPVGQPIASPRT